MFSRNVFFAVVSATAVVNAGPLNLRQDPAQPQASGTAGNSSLDALAAGNKDYQNGLKNGPNNSTNATSPYMFIGCSDSKVDEELVFKTQPGSLLTQNNLGNIFYPGNKAADSAVTYSVTDQGVKHVFVLGHYGCSTVKSVLANNSAFEDWVSPIQKVLASSDRSEIKKFRDDKSDHTKLSDNDPAFIALVEESTKASVKRFANSTLFGGNDKPSASDDKKNKRAEKEKPEVWVHGLVLNETSGEVFNLNVSIGSTGKDVPAIPFAAIQNATAEPGVQVVTKTVTVENQEVTVAASVSSAKPEETITTTVKNQDVTITVSATPSASASSSASQQQQAAQVTVTTQVQNQDVTVTVDPSKSAETILTTVKGQDATVTVTPSAAASQK